MALRTPSQEYYKRGFLNRNYPSTVHLDGIEHGLSYAPDDIVQMSGFDGVMCPAMAGSAS
jgi:hypothetical protein